MPVVPLIFYGNASANKLKWFFICKQKVNGTTEAFFLNMFLSIRWIHPMVE